MKKQAQFFKALSDHSRLRIINSLIESPKYVELLSERLELKPSTISFHLKKLMDVGLVQKYKDQYYVIYSIKTDVLNRPLIDWIKLDHSQQEEENLREEAYRQKIIDSFFKFEKLTNIPVQRKKRIVVLLKILEAFHKEHTYTEKEVNLIIADFHDDFATIRKDLVAEKMMKRNNGKYQRIK